MLYLFLAMILDIAVFTTGLTMSIIDVNKYNFGLYLVLMSVVTFSLLIALWVAKPKFCRTPNWAINFYHLLVKSSRPINYEQRKRRGGKRKYHQAEDESLVNNDRARTNADEIMRSIKGIPLLIQAIQYSLEAAYVPVNNRSSTGTSTTAPTTQTDSANETTSDYYPTTTNPMATTTTPTGSTSSGSGGESPRDRSTSPTTDRSRIPSAHCRSPRPYMRGDMKRQSIFVVFPYSETGPVDQSKWRLRRSSSEHDLECGGGVTIGGVRHPRKSSFERFCQAAIAGTQSTRCASSILPTVVDSDDDDRAARLERSRRLLLEAVGSTECAEERIKCHSQSTLKIDSSMKRINEIRRPSLEVRYVGLQSILLQKMSAKHRQDSS